MNQLKLTQENLLVFKEAVKAMAEFRKAFNRDLEPSFIAELYAAEKLELEIFPSKTMPGYDALDKAGKRYQIKYRSPMTQNVDINNYDFDLLILINLDENYRLCGIWRISVDQAKKYSLGERNIENIKQLKIKLSTSQKESLERERLF